MINFLFIFLLCFGAFAAEKSVIVSTGQQDITSMTQLDPHERTPEHLDDINRQIYDTLYEIDESGNVTEGLVSSCHVSSFEEDVESNVEMRVVCKIKKGIYFHDGIELTPRDVVYSILRLKASATLSSYVYIISGVAAMSDGSSVKFTLRYNVKGVQDPQNWLFERFKRMFARYSYIVRADYFTGGAGWALEYPVGTGPFYFKDWKLWNTKESRSQIILERNKSYWKQSHSKFHKLLFRFLPASLWQNSLSKGEISLLFRMPYKNYVWLKKGNKKRGDFKVFKRLVYSYQYLIFTPSSKVFDSKDVRKAFAMGVNRSKIANNAFGPDAVVNSSSALYSSTVYPEKFLPQVYDPRGSKKIVKAYMKAKKIKAEKLTLSLLVPDTYEAVLVTGELIKELSLAGFAVKVQKLPYAAYNSLINRGTFGKYDLVMYSVNENPKMVAPRVKSILKSGGLQLYQRHTFYALSRPEKETIAKAITNFVPPVEGPLVLYGVE
ncbi:MAG: ABC transporter substrate-binding protein [Pseudomonadota bacterium]